MHMLVVDIFTAIDFFGFSKIFTVFDWLLVSGYMECNHFTGFRS